MKRRPYDPASCPWKSRLEKFLGLASAPSPTADRAPPPYAPNYQATDVMKAPSQRPGPAAPVFDGRSRRVEPPDPAADETCVWSAWPTSEAHAVAGIHRALAREIANLLAQCAGSYGIVVGFFLPEGEFRRRLWWLPHDLFVLREFWLAANAAIRGVIRLLFAG